jgi:hypothetical protein
MMSDKLPLRHNRDISYRVYFILFLQYWNDQEEEEERDFMTKQHWQTCDACSADMMSRASMSEWFEYVSVISQHEATLDKQSSAREGMFIIYYRWLSWNLYHPVFEQCHDLYVDDDMLSFHLMTATHTWTDSSWVSLTFVVAGDNGTFFFHSLKEAKFRNSMWT